MHADRDPLDAGASPGAGAAPVHVAALPAPLHEAAMVTDAKADARMLGPERTAALVREVLMDTHGSAAATVRQTDVLDAARRLAAPPPAEPQWPERVWAVFHRGDGRHVAYTETPGSWECMDYTVLPARLVPLDGSRVVLDAKHARVLLGAIRRPRVEFMDPGPPIIHWPDGTGDAIAALDRALADTEGK